MKFNLIEDLEKVSADRFYATIPLGNKLEPYHTGNWKMFYDISRKILLRNYPSDEHFLSELELEYESDADIRHAIINSNAVADYIYTYADDLIDRYKKEYAFYYVMQRRESTDFDAYTDEKKFKDNEEEVAKRTHYRKYGYALDEELNRDRDKFSATINFDKIEYLISLDPKHPSPNDPDNVTEERTEEDYDYILMGRVDCDNFIDTVIENYFEFPPIKDKYNLDNLSDEEIDKILDTDEVREFIYDNAQDIINSNIEFFRDYYYDYAKEEVEDLKQEEYNYGW